MTDQEIPMKQQSLFGVFIAGPGGKRGIIESFCADAAEQTSIDDLLERTELVIADMLFGTEYDRDDFTVTPLWIDVVTLPES